MINIIHSGVKEIQSNFNSDEFCGEVGNIAMAYGHSLNIGEVFVEGPAFFQSTATLMKVYNCLLDYEKEMYHEKEKKRSQ